MLARGFTALVGRLVELVAPACCAACDVPLGMDGLLCPRCAAGVGRMPRENLTAGVPLVAGGRYEGALGEAIRKLKYGGRPDLARPLGRELARTVGVALGREPWLVVPVPLHARRLADRGYNQSALIALALARVLSWECHPRALIRTEATRAQASLERRERLANVSGAFSARERFDGRRVVVVDDVVTTGATALACVDAISVAGASAVVIAAVTRTARPGEAEKGSIPGVP